jgi:hypothetical protein
MITDDELVQFHREGFIPGPLEEESSFLKRVQKTKALFEGKVDHPFLKNEKISLDGVVERLKKLFGIASCHFLAVFGSDRLALWEGGATFFFEDEEKINIPILQVKKRFKKGWWSKLYPLEEILAHEAVHAMRISFNENRFEEIFAYKTSKNWRSFFGALFSRPFESWIFLLSILLSLFFLSPLPASLVLAYFFFRLFWRQRTLKRCLTRLTELVGKNALPMALCLMDDEIKAFASKTSVKEDGSLRWRLIEQFRYPPSSSIQKNR